MRLIPMEVDPYEPVDVELLSRRDAEATRRFCRQMRTRGLAVLRVREREAAVFEECVEAAKSYFAGSTAEQKALQRMGDDGARDWGYVEMAEVKEFWQMRHNAPVETPWPVLARSYFEANTALSRVALAALARGIETAEENLTDKMMDPPGDEGLSSTIFRFFHYYGAGDIPLVERQMGCMTHTDIGLITLIPCTNCASLEIMDHNDYRWRTPETGLGRRDVMVLCGETLEQLCGFLYPAVVHRVARVPQDRYSLVFLLRARPNAVLDCASLDSGVLKAAAGDHLAGVEALRPVTVAKFMRDKYLNKKSANFNAGQGMPLANLKGEEINGQDVERWKDSGDRPDDNEYY